VVDEGLREHASEFCRALWGGGLVSLDWPKLRIEVERMTHRWTNRIIDHAREEGQFFAVDDPDGNIESGV